MDGGSFYPFRPDLFQIGSAGSDKVLAVMPNICAAIGIGLLAAAWAVQARSYQVKDDPQRGRAKKPLAYAYGSSARLLVLAGVFDLVAAWAIVFMFGFVQPKCNVPPEVVEPIVWAIFTFALVLAVASFWHEEYRRWKTLDPRSVFAEDFVPEWRQRYSEFLESTFASYDDRVRGRVRALFARVLRPLLPVCSVYILTAEAVRLLDKFSVLQRSDWWPVVFGIPAGLMFTKYLYWFTGLDKYSCQLYELRKSQCCYFLVLREDTGEFLIAHQLDADLPFSGQWCFPQCRLTASRGEELKSVRAGAKLILAQSGTGLELGGGGGNVSYVLRSTVKLYDDFEHDDWQYAHLFTCRTKGTATGNASAEYGWASLNDPRLVGCSKVFIQDALRMYAVLSNWQADPGKEIRYWSQARGIPNLSNRPQ